MTAAIRILGVFAICAMGFADPAQSEEVRVRKSIDRLTADELENYAYAVKKLREKSLNDPLVKYSYAHMAGIHNVPELFGGACEHWNHRFFPWHRALMLNFEDALRAIDPPRTSQISLPYWDWTSPPSGKRYPVAFENDAQAVEEHYGRPIPPELLKALHETNRNTDASGPYFPWTEIRRIVLREGTTEFLGSGDDHGSLENPPHDEMHGFIGGWLVSTATAADDAIFWSFHTYIDLLWWLRQETVNDSVPCQNCPLNGMEARTAIREDGPTIVSAATDAKSLGYSYDYAPPPSPPMPAADDQSLSERLPVLASKSLEQPDVLRRFELVAPATRPKSIQLNEVLVPTRLAYLAFVYLHPKAIPFDGTSAAFRDQYWVGHFGQWANAHHGHASRTFAIDLADMPHQEFSEGTDLVVTVAIHVQAVARESQGVAVDASRRMVDDDSRIGTAVLLVDSPDAKRN